MNFLKKDNKIIHSSGDATWLAATGVCCLIGLVGLASYLIYGHDAYNIHRQVPWGLLISSYVFFALSCSGLCMIAALGRVFNFEPFHAVGKRMIAMAIIAIIAAFMVIGLELGHPLRMIYNLISPNLAAPIWWMGTIYSIYLAVLIFEFTMMVKGQHRYAGYASIIAFVGGILAVSTVGSVFGLQDARSFWQGPFIPFSFVLIAAASGCALLFLLLAYRYGQEEMPPEVLRARNVAGKIFTVLLGALLFLEFWWVITAVYSGVPGTAQAMMTLLDGPLALNYWILSIIIGLALPFVLMLISGGRYFKLEVVAALAVMIGFFVRHYNIVVAGQLVPLRPDVDRVDLATGLVSYSPSVTEIAIVIGGFGLCLALYFVANRIFNLDAEVVRH